MTGHMGRRRFLTISAGALVAAGATVGAQVGCVAPGLTQWRGTALGAAASVTIAHPDADRISATVVAEIERLEDIFSLYRAESSLSLLNRDGRLDTPPFELLECLGICDWLHGVTAGRFDPTVQPLWRLYADTRGRPDEEARAAALGLVGWRDLRFGADTVVLARPGMALTLNGVAQGYIADRIARLLRGAGLRDVLVETGEFIGLGAPPGQAAWAVHLDREGEVLPVSVPLRDLALASSAPGGTTFDLAGVVGHILDPHTGRPSTQAWRLVSVTHPSAAIADGLSSALALMPRAEIAAVIAKVPQARLVWLG